jgi:CDP-diacylglycerol---glycerol-3-phosphate 3-phosphatidyltransferase
MPSTFNLNMNNKNIPLSLTLFRIFLTIPIAVGLSFQNENLNWLCVVLFYIASITDYYDGYYARKLNAVTNLGKFLDPVADKILVTSVLVVLVFLQKVDIWMVILFISRDTLIGGIRAAASADQIIIDAQTTGKWKAALQMISIPLLMVNDLHLYFPSQKIGYGLLWFSVGLSMLSGYQYIQLYFDSKNKLSS